MPAPSLTGFFAFVLAFRSGGLQPGEPPPGGRTLRSDITHFPSSRRVPHPCELCKGGSCCLACVLSASPPESCKIPVSSEAIRAVPIGALKSASNQRNAHLPCTGTADRRNAISCRGTAQPCPRQASPAPSPLPQHHVAASPSRLFP